MPGLLSTNPLYGALSEAPRGILGEAPPNGLLGPATANPLIARQVAAQRAANPRPDVTDIFGYGPTWETYLNAIATNLQAKLPKLEDDPQERVKKGLELVTSFAPFGLTVFHGSPHRFDKFDMSKVGTGEGAQAYGYGLYFAENPGVAKSYSLAGQSGFAGQAQQNIVQGALQKFGDEKAARSAIHKAAMDLPPSQRQPYFDAYNNFDSLKNAGNVYKVDLPDEAIGKMLDWDKPLSQQPESVRRALERAPFEVGGGVNMTGADIVDAASAYAAKEPGQRDPRAGAELLRSLGIPGIQYLDQASRLYGKGTRNFVVFDDQLPKIIGRE